MVKILESSSVLVKETNSRNLKIQEFFFYLFFIYLEMWQPTEKKQKKLKMHF